VAKYYDTLLWEYIKNPWVRWLSLDKLALKNDNYEMISYDQVTNKKKLNFKEVELDSAAIYSAEDVYITNQIFLQHKEEGTTDIKILNDIELPLLEVLMNMELTWVHINRDTLKGIGLLLENEIDSLEKTIIHEAGEEFNIKSPKQVGEVLFEKLWLPKGKKTKTWYSVSADVLWELSHEFPIAQNIVDYRHYSKLQSTYVEWLLDLLDDNELVHTSYNSAVTTTWRLSSTKPNLQNIPSSHWIAWEIRSAFVSRFENWIIMAADYSQVEVRLLAIMSGDENLLWAFKNEIDIHHKTAEFIFPWSTITNNERKIAKAVNFWVIYWISWFWLSKMLGINMKDAKIYIDKFYENYPKVREYLDNTIKNCEEKGYVETMFWRRRYLPSINDRNSIIKSAANREAINMPIQWTNADIIKIAMIKIAEFLKRNSLKSKMIMQVHDELVFDVIPEEKEILKTEIKIIMENIVQDIPIPLKVDIESWLSWKEAK